VVAVGVHVFLGHEAAAAAKVLGHDEIVAARRMHAQQVDQRHRRRHGQLDVEADTDEHLQTPAALNECRVSKLPMARPGRACAIGDAGFRKAARRPRPE
jgi:hypothetical protein